MKSDLSFTQRFKQFGMAGIATVIFSVLATPPSVASAQALNGHMTELGETPAAVAKSRAAVANLRGKQQFGFVALNVANMDKMLAFYKGVVGLEESARMDRPTSLIVMVDYPGNDVAIPHLHLIFNKKGADGSPIPKGNIISRIAFFVNDVEDVARRLAAAGYAVDGPTEMTDVKLKYLFTWDPEGNRVEFIQPI